MFRLDKWYLDLVTDAGTVIIVYSAQLAWRGARVGYGSVLVSLPDAPVEERSAFGLAAAPKHEGECITWHHSALNLGGSWRALAAPIETCLFESADGRIEWRCSMPRSRAAIDFDDGHHSGLGYVEHLTLTIPPWKLPFNHVRWGRYTSKAHAVVWIAWDGANTRRFLWYDGVLQPDAILEDRCIRGLRDGAELRLGKSRDVCARPALARLIDRLPALVQPLAAPVAAMFEHKMVARSRVVLMDAPVDSGWSLFEEVRW